MRISTKGSYAVEIVVDLALYGDGKRPTSVKSIAARREISEKYLERIMSMLKKAGIVNSTRGPQGGYRLVKAPEELTVLEVLEATEGNLAPVECLTNNSNCGMDCEECATRDTWNHIWDIIKDTVKDITIKQLRDWAEEKEV